MEQKNSEQRVTTRQQAAYVLRTLADLGYRVPLPPNKMPEDNSEELQWILIAEIILLRYETVTHRNFDVPAM